MQLPTQQTHQNNIYTVSGIRTLTPTSWTVRPPGPAYEDDMFVCLFILAQQSPPSGPGPPHSRGF